MADLLYGLLGRTLGHSWSVPIHTALGCPGYQLFEREPEQLEAFLHQENLGAINVTIPYKQAVMPFCDEIDDLARSIGSVNTIVHEGGKLRGFNTDAIGFCRMAEGAGIDFCGKKAVILGSGGASLTAQAMARKLGARQVVVVSRHGEDNYDNLSRHADAEIVVNATPVGMFPHTGEQAVDLTAFPRCEGVLDLIYNPRRTALLLQAEELGLPHSDGLPMLVEQAVAAEEYFFHKTFDSVEGTRILRSLRQEMTNLVLIGMPGCGKTTVGKLLAEKTGREAIDIDEEIVKRTGRSIPELFSTVGEAFFRQLEREETARVGALSGKLILTGGGVVKDPRNYPSLHQNGWICQLDRSLDALATEGRPLSQATAARQLWAEREPLYRRFRDSLIDNNGKAEDAADAIWRDFCAHSGS